MTFRMHLAAVAAALLLAACGGSDPAITSVKVMGDSLADSGTFGLKFTVQGSAATGTGSTPIWPELVAQAVADAGPLCAYYRVNLLTQAVTTQTGCSNYAVGGGRINNASNPQDPRSITLQLQNAAQVNGSYKSTDLLLIDGGGNDAAEVVGAYLGAASGAQGLATYRALLASLLPAATVDTLLGQVNGPEQAGGAYMVALANAFHGAIQASALDKGASKIALLNLPDITLTPRFQQVLAGVAQQAGAAQAQQAQALFRQWITAFNTQLASRFAGNAKVAVVDFYGTLTDQVAHPAKYGLSNAAGTACPVVSVGSDGLPNYNFLTCTATALSANPPGGLISGPNWWKTYLFSDSFHPTPYGHQLLADSVSAAVRAKGWN